MNFKTKIFLSLLAVSMFLSIGILIGTYFVVRNYINDEFFSRYNSLGNVVANMFHQMGKVSDQVNKNAVTILKTISKFSAIPSNRDLSLLANQVGIQGFYVINKDGKFIRSSDLPLKKQKNSLFSYCAGYRNLVDGTLNQAVTPIIPSYPYGIPSKFIMIPNANRNMILEAGVHLSYIGQILHNSVEYNKNIISIGLFSPNGYMLGFISSDGKFTQGEDKISVSALSGNYIKSKTVVFNFKIPANVGYCCECKIKDVQNLTSGRYYYILQMTVSKKPLMQALHNLRKDFLFLFIIALIISFVISSYLSKKLVARINKMNQVIDDIIYTGNLKRTVDIGKTQDELSVLADRFNTMIAKLEVFRLKDIEYEKIKGIEKISKQVAHDVRSPLTALEMVFKRIPKMEESKWIIVRDSLNHIRDITNNLDKGNFILDRSDLLWLTQIAVLLESVISERRIAFSNLSMKIENDFSPDQYAFFVNVVPVEMKRILTNIVNNACEAIVSTDMRVSISLKKSENKIVIVISDNGAGIPTNLFSSLFIRGFTTKEKGSGLGLVHAKEKLEEWRGAITVKPNVDRGVSVFITLPLQSPPQWFVENLILFENTEVVCVDDSIEIFHAWKERINSINKHVVMIYCESKEKLTAFLHEKNETIKTYFVDYEFSGKNYSGIDLMNMILLRKNKNDRLFLVTSRSNEIAIHCFCEENNIQIIPKYFAFKIALEVIA
ncbi:MAG: hypothetical protein ACD_29C00471G0003 [uncultured bacterium]|nr:MAG: hypothetical protein ACD_29C00471G0003 [uncultured bacterium]OGT33551.1 MAG: hypothetical protein A3C44_01525 [Gammaproteobacteria bacterium RIFCSPHIGHO2_02_FULL_39_13]OGT49566.1 MAG: hypothetical protein A3E53_00270 [Gammaproteobacteria bacterium RIFCSPHIGHO2_12_FULL_39_24]